jgi:hypothetical protein
VQKSGRLKDYHLSKESSCPKKRWSRTTGRPLISTPPEAWGMKDGGKGKGRGGGGDGEGDGKHWKADKNILVKMKVLLTV